MLVDQPDVAVVAAVLARAGREVFGDFGAGALDEREQKERDR